MNKRILYSLIGLLLASASWAQVPAPAPGQSEPIAIMNATAHLGDGTVIENSIVTFDKGKLVNVVDATRTRIDLSGYRQIAAQGKHVYPGLILPVTNLGLVEVNSVRATRDFNETGDINPNIRSLVAYNTDSELIPTMKFNGIQLAQTTPQGGLVPGTSTIVQLDAWNWEDAAYKTDDALHISWPSLTYGPRWWMGETERRDNENYKEQVEAIVTLINDAKAYAASSPSVKNLKLEAMKGALTGDKRVFVQADRAAEIVEAIQTLKGLDIPKLVLVGAEDVWYVKDLIKEHNIPILLSNIHRRPGREEEDVHLPYKLPGMLHQEGILVGLMYDAGMIANARNLPFIAGTASAYGISKEEALKLVTSNTAKILGIEGTTGMLKGGLDANVVISSGDLLDMRTSQVEYSFIQGREVDLEALQQRLYEKFKEKYESQK